jgi:hypothetical protein
MQSHGEEALGLIPAGIDAPSRTLVPGSESFDE